MSNFRNVLDTQQRINEAAKAIMDYFGNEMPYYVHLEQMLSAQTQIIGLMELVKMHMISNPNDELDFKTDEITRIEADDLRGRLLFETPASGLKADLDISTWPRGTYLLRIQTPAGPTTKKLLIQ